MRHRFRLKGTDLVFTYDNITNVIHDWNGNQITKPNGLPQKPIRENVVKHNRPKEIKIVLGQSCNYSCGYCLQRDIGDHSRKAKSWDADALIARMKAMLYLDDLEQLELWGGETLLWWDEMKKIISAFDRPEFDFVFPTNGTILNAQHVEYLAGIQGRTTIELSHDGPKHEELRGRDFLPGLVPVLKLMEDYPEKMRVVFSVTITNRSYDLNALNDYFRDFFTNNGLKPIPVMFRPVWAYDKLSKEFSLHDVLEDYRNVLSSYLDRHISQFRRLKKVTDDEMLQSHLFHITQDDDENHGILQIASNFRYEMNRDGETVCGMHADDHLTIDHLGNIRACQNVGSETFNGNILDFAADDEISVSGLSVKRKEKCLKCPVYSFCLSGCPLDLNDDIFDINCRIHYTHHIVMLLKSLQILFNREVEWLGEE